MLDLRTTKFVNLGGERRIGLFAEFFNLFNTVNFGNSYNGNGRSATFQHPPAISRASATRDRCSSVRASCSKVVERTRTRTE